MPKNPLRPPAKQAAAPTKAAVPAKADAPKKDPKIVARDVIAKALRCPTGNAQNEVAQLNPQEIASLTRLIGDKDAKQKVKGILSRAYDRRTNESAAKAARAAAK